MQADFRRRHQRETEPRQIIDGYALRRLRHVPEVDQRRDRHDDAVARLGIASAAAAISDRRDEPWTYQTMACESVTTLTRTR